MMLPRCLRRAVLCSSRALGSPRSLTVPCYRNLSCLLLSQQRALAVPTSRFCAERPISTGSALLQVKDKRVSVQSRGDGASPQTASHKGGLFYVVFEELFSSSSPSKIYGEALEKCRSHPEVIGAFGEPIKGYGETTRRGRRQHVSHMEYVKDGIKCMRLKFYIEGLEPRKQGTVHTEVKENPESGKYEFQYIFVEIDTYPRRTIVIEDNRRQS
ncbi:mitochondrial import inner membrane translocase subunit Tim21 isoform X1 [Xenopus tropicalis]|uniref:Mitochondrial import inner membrane translocase subunit Tim21 n=1 Tax=Xenopus tropicalis TaxID=8364 RepID=A0A8J0SG98_XENTR|nr:mitochondrial import inner membrane translocase subunit Tim21 isoform X1 [Xenopus tropicalis]|eukprot:XP_012820156.1 PREDICTED: mitochondrial import inner membrane translocase subunit Tim21 isoform X1 [Xenopus tropicalis]